MYHHSNVNENQKSSDKQKRHKKDKQNLLSNTTNTDNLLINNMKSLHNINKLGNNSSSDTAMQKLKNQSLFLQQQQQQQQQSKKLTINNLTSGSHLKAASSTNTANTQKISELTSLTNRNLNNRRQARHQLSQQQHHQQPNLQRPNNILSTSGDFNEIYDSENNLDTPQLPVDTKKPSDSATVTAASSTANAGTLDIMEMNRRLLTVNKFNIDLNDLTECNTYDEELKLNNIENLEAILNDTKSCLGTSNEKDGYWCFKRKEGCKYLPVSRS